MGVLARDDKQFTLIYSSQTRVGKHTLSYLQGIEDKVHTVDISKVKVDLDSAALFALFRRK